MTDYIKFWFSQTDGPSSPGSIESDTATCGLILPRDKYSKKSITELSAMFPYSETPKMRFLHAIDGFSTFEEAFNWKG